MIFHSKSDGINLLRNYILLHKLTEDQLSMLIRIMMSYVVFFFINFLRKCMHTHRDTITYSRTW